MVPLCAVACFQRTPILRWPVWWYWYYHSNTSRHMQERRSVASDVVPLCMCSLCTGPQPHCDWIICTSRVLIVQVQYLREHNASVSGKCRRCVSPATCRCDNITVQNWLLGLDDKFNSKGLSWPVAVVHFLPETIHGTETPSLLLLLDYSVIL